MALFTVTQKYQHVGSQKQFSIVGKPLSDVK